MNCKLNSVGRRKKPDLNSKIISSNINFTNMSVEAGNKFTIFVISVTTTLSYKCWYCAVISLDSTNESIISKGLFFCLNHHSIIDWLWILDMVSKVMAYLRIFSVVYVYRSMCKSVSLTFAY